jgi:hypothetical protein
MIALTATNQILELNTSSTSNIDVIVSFTDHTTTGGTLGTQDALITTATNTTILSAPASSTQRQVKMISINNTSSTTNTVIVKKDVGGTEYDIIRAVLSQNERLEYTDMLGWEVYANSGGRKSSINQGNSPTSSSTSASVLASDVVNNNATANTIQDVTGLSFPVIANKTYWFNFQIQYSAAATTTGSRWAINGPSTTRLNYISEYSLTTTTTTRNTQNTAYDLPAASNATSATTGSNWAIIEGMITVSADGNVIARFASEVASSAITALAGSVVYYQQLN